MFLDIPVLKDLPSTLRISGTPMLFSAHFKVNFSRFHYLTQKTRIKMSKLLSNTRTGFYLNDFFFLVS